MVFLCNILRRYLVGKPYMASLYRNGTNPTIVPFWKCHRQNLSTDIGTSGGTERVLSALKQSWTDRLARAEVPEAEGSVNLIVAHAFGKKKISEVDMEIQPDKDTLKTIENMLSEKLKRVPVPYIIGEMDFLDMTLEMKEPVFMPRPKTENFADFIVKQWPLSRDQSARFLEIGCGTGAISLYILRHYPKVTCTAVDKSVSACELTLRNASRYNLQDRIRMIHGDILEADTISELSRDGPYHMIVSNPPYLTEDEAISMAKEIVDYEDHDAINGGTDGLHLLRKILMESHKLLKDQQSSLLWLEVGIGHPEKIQRFVEMHPEFMLSYLETLKDFTGISRFCKLLLKK